MPKADIEVEVTLNTINGVEEAVPQVQHLNPMNRQKTVHYFTSVPDAAVRIEFVPNPNPPKPQASLSPFVDSNGNAITTITSADPPLMLQKDGEFSCRCFVTLKNGQVIGWSPSSPNSGGNHIVK